MLHLNFTSFPNLTTERLLLRRLSIKDAKEIMMLRSNEHINKFIDRPKSIDLSEAKEFIRKINDGINNNEWIYWAITLKENDTLIGTICLWNISIENDIAELAMSFKLNGREKE